MFTVFPKQEYWSGLRFPSLGDLPDPGIELTSPALKGPGFPYSHRIMPSALQSNLEYFLYNNKFHSY